MLILFTNIVQIVYYNRFGCFCNVFYTDTLYIRQFANHGSVILFCYKDFST